MKQEIDWASEVTEWRRSVGISQKCAAKIVGVHERTFQRWEAGEWVATKWREYYRKKMQQGVLYPRLLSKKDPQTP